MTSSLFLFSLCLLGPVIYYKKGKGKLCSWAELKQVLQITLISFPREENIHFRYVVKETNFYHLPFPMAQWVKNPSAMQETQETQVRFLVGKIPWRRNDNPLQSSCLKSPTDRGAWQAIVHGVTKSQTWLKWLSLRKLLLKIKNIRKHFTCVFFQHYIYFRNIY